MQINLGQFKISTVDKGFVSIGPSIQNVIRGRQDQNQGFGELVGDKNETEISELRVHDNDVIDFPIKRIHINKVGR